MEAESSTVIKVNWSLPAVRDRNDSYYTVEFSDPDNFGNLLLSAHLNGNVTMHKIPFMRPFTSYCVRVTAHNGVSDQDEEGNHLRMAEACLTMPEDGESLTHGNIQQFLHIPVVYIHIFRAWANIISISTFVGIIFSTHKGLLVHIVYSHSQGQSFIIQHIFSHCIFSSSSWSTS